MIWRYLSSHHHLLWLPWWWTWRWEGSSWEWLGDIESWAWCHHWWRAGRATSHCQTENWNQKVCDFRHWCIFKLRRWNVNLQSNFTCLARLFRSQWLSTFWIFKMPLANVKCWKSVENIRNWIIFQNISLSTLVFVSSSAQIHYWLSSRRSQPWLWHETLHLIS